MSDLLSPLYSECTHCVGTGRSQRKHDGFQTLVSDSPRKPECGHCAGWGICVPEDARPIFDLIAEMMRRRALV